MGNMQCRHLHKKYYSDAYHSNRNVIFVDNVPFSLMNVGFKYCSQCEFFTALEPYKMCRCCHILMKRSHTKYEVNKKRWLAKKGLTDKITLKYQELVNYSNMIDIVIPRRRALRPYLRRKKTNKKILYAFIKNH